MSHPLDSEFDLENSNLINEDNEDIIIPEIKNLDVIIDFALQNYKELLDDCKLMEPKSQLKAKELARDFLREAKDAMDKKEKLLIARERIQKSKGKVSPSEGEGEGNKPAGGVSRAELASRLKAVK